MTSLVSGNRLYVVNNTTQVQVNVVGQNSAAIAASSTNTAEVSDLGLLAGGVPYAPTTASSGDAMSNVAPPDISQIAAPSATSTKGILAGQGRPFT